MKILLGNKSDSYKKIVDYETGAEFARSRNFDAFFEVSAKDKRNMNTSISLLAELLGKLTMTTLLLNMNLPGFAVLFQVKICHQPSQIITKVKKPEINLRKCQLETLNTLLKIQNHFPTVAAT